MIDYDKLKFAHELADKFAEQDCYAVEIATRLFSSDGQQPCFYLTISEDNCMEFTNLDDLVEKLQELTQHESKFKVGEKAWIKYTHFNGLDKFEDVTITSSPLDGCYEVEWNRTKNKCTVREHHLYPTKESLIQAQIDYWSNLMPKDDSSLEAAHKEIMELEINPRAVCHHESDGRVHCITPTGHLTSSIPGSLPAGMKKVNKCKKCREFYRDDN